MDVLQNMKLFSELIQCGGTVYTWCYNADGSLLQSNCPDEVFLSDAFDLFGCKQRMIEYGETHSIPITLGTSLGLFWEAVFEKEDAPSKAFLAATNRVGLAFNYDSLQLSDYRISCVGTALKLYNQMGEKIYCEALRLIVAAWDGRPDSFRASVLRGVMHFVELYHGEFSEDRLIRALGSVHPMEIYRVGRDNPAKLPGWKKYVFPIYMAYNGKGRKDALPMKF